MRTNILIDDELMERAKKLTGIKTKREVVQKALQILILVNEQKKTRSLRGQLLLQGNLDKLRESRIPN